MLSEPELEELLRDASTASGAYVHSTDVRQFITWCGKTGRVVLTVHGFSEDAKGFRRVDGKMLFGIEPGSMSPTEASQHFLEAVGPGSGNSLWFNVFV